MLLLWEGVSFDRFSGHQLEVVGRGGLIQARVLKLKKAVKGDANAREVSDALPFLGMVISKPHIFSLFYFIILTIYCAVYRHADPDPTFHFDADRDPDPYHTRSFMQAGKSEKYFDFK
jgi:hypothetical protein